MADQTKSLFWKAGLVCSTAKESAVERLIAMNIDAKRSAILNLQKPSTAHDLRTLSLIVHVAKHL